LSSRLFSNCQNLLQLACHNTASETCMRMPVFCDLQQAQDVILKKPKVRLTNNPLSTEICIRLVQMPSSRINQHAAAMGQKKPMRLPQSISSSPPSSSDPAAPPFAAFVGSFSSHLSSSDRSSSPIGMVSGVWVCAWMAMNCARRLATSPAEKPAVRRRSNPRGAGVEEVAVAS